MEGNLIKALDQFWRLKRILQKMLIPTLPSLFLTVALNREYFGPYTDTATDKSNLGNNVKN